MDNKIIYGVNCPQELSKYHYVYRITNTLTGLYYYGARSSKCQPKDDLGLNYFSSFGDKSFIQDQRDNPQNYKYKVIKVFQDRAGAILYESKLHAKFDVKNHPKFINKSNQTSSGFDTSGTGTAKCPITGKILGQIPLSDPRWKTGEIVGNIYRSITITNSKNNSLVYDSRDVPEGWWIGSSLFGKMYINNGSIETPINKDEIIPSGWIEGRLPTRKTITDGNEIKNIGRFEQVPEGWCIIHPNSGRFFINNGIMELRIKPEDPIPEGFQLGTLHPNRVLINNGIIELRIKPEDPIPEGFQLGPLTRNRIYINNGTMESFHPLERPIPEGWVKGRLPTKRISITNGIINKRIQDGNSIPEGWWVGKTKSTKISITNGQQCKKVDRESDIPEGWYIGTPRYRVLAQNQDGERIILELGETIPDGFSELTKSRMIVDVYDSNTDELIEENTTCKLYSMKNLNVDPTRLAKTCFSDRSAPKSKDNVKDHNGVYVRQK